ncbi:hypothetical protein AURDEDRAFT_173777 [Auricularia subglabra TFB-10046 SS5]|nr:hypothetical protein AURDEDRAFT_173777 [Auricularia subglabra TFB-10046 SS5]
MASNRHWVPVSNDQAQAGDRQDTKPIIPQHEVRRRMGAFLDAVCDPLNPTCCAWCFAVLVFSVSKDTKSKLMLQKRGHAFIQACLCLLVYYSETHIPKLRMALAQGQQSLFSVVQLGLTSGENPVCAQSSEGDSFHRRNGFWPVTIKQLFPLGVARTVDALVHWSGAPASYKPLYVLVSYLRVARPVIFPALLESPRRERVVWLVIQALTLGPGVPWTGGEPPFAMPPGLSAPTTLRRDGTLILPAYHILSDIRSGNKAHGDDAQRLFAGYEAPLCVALKAVIAPPKYADQVSDYLCWLGTAVGDDAGCTHNVPDIPKLELLYKFLLSTIGGRWCCGPGCGKNEVSFEEGVKHFRRCELCLLVRYCGRDCQRKDWKHGAPRHRDICPILAAAHRRGVVITEGHEKFLESILDAEMEAEDLDALCDWALGGNLVPQSRHLLQKAK